MTEWNLQGEVLIISQQSIRTTPVNKENAAFDICQRCFRWQVTWQTRGPGPSVVFMRVHVPPLNYGITTGSVSRWQSASYKYITWTRAVIF